VKRDLTSYTENRINIDIILHVHHTFNHDIITHEGDEKLRNKKILGALVIFVLVFTLMACTQGTTSSEPNSNTLTETPIITESPTEVITEALKDVTPTTAPSKEPTKEPVKKPVKSDSSSKTTYEYAGNTYKIIEVDGGDLSGDRQSNVAVDIGFGDREYWALTNKHGQLVYVITDEIILQDDSTEPVNSDGRYYNDEAKVPGVENDNLDEGHVIADSLGGVSNAYNITPQDSTLNRHGDQAYMEKVIRDAGGCEDFLATITYPDTKTQTPSHYHYEYVLNGESIVDDFDNVNPDEVNASLIQAPTKTPSKDKKNDIVKEKNDLSKVDTNGNGKVTIAEAKAAGYKMPIYSDHWLYQYMDDRDGDGVVGE
jgi:hypothetical protein